jgi:hypothetical protein
MGPTMLAQSRRAGVVESSGPAGDRSHDVLQTVLKLHATYWFLRSLPLYTVVFWAIGAENKYYFVFK